MGAFSYLALDDGGRSQRGVLEAESPRQVREMLRDRGLTPLEVEVVERGRVGVGLVRLSPGERAVTLRQLATLTTAGLPLEEALATVAEQSDHPATGQIFSALRARVREGHDLADAMREYPLAFPSELLAAVAAGEKSGALGPVLERLAEFAEQRQGLGREVLLAMLYPVIVVIVALGVVAALMVSVVPRVVQVFQHAGRELPLLTRWLIGASNFTSAHALWLSGALVLLIASGFAAWRRPGVRAWFQGLLARLPGLGRALSAAATARFCRSLSLQVSSNVPLVDALQISAGATGQVALRRAVLAAAERVREGASLNAALRAERALPPLVQRLVASGEQTGRLPEMLEHAAAAQESEASALARTFSALLQPAMILLVGLFVLLVVLAVMLPILNLNQLVT